MVGCDWGISSDHCWSKMIQVWIQTYHSSCISWTIDWARSIPIHCLLNSYLTKQDSVLWSLPCSPQLVCARDQAQWGFIFLWNMFAGNQIIHETSQWSAHHNTSQFCHKASVKANNPCSLGFRLCNYPQWTKHIICLCSIHDWLERSRELCPIYMNSSCRNIWYQHLDHWNNKKKKLFTFISIESHDGKVGDDHVW